MTIFLPRLSQSRQRMGAREGGMEGRKRISSIISQSAKVWPPLCSRNGGSHFHSPPPKRKRKIIQKRYISFPALTALLVFLQGKKKRILTISGTKPNPHASSEASTRFDLATRTEGDVILKNQSVLAPPSRRRGRRSRHKISGSEDVFAAVHVRRSRRALGWIMPVLRADDRADWSRKIIHDFSPALGPAALNH